MGYILASPQTEQICNYFKVFSNMEINEFIKNFVDQFDDLELADVTPDTVMRDLDEWSSMIGLSLLNMAEKEYGVTLTFDELRHAITVQNLFDTIANKQK
jgi:acyl carrier protein